MNVLIAYDGSDGAKRGLEVVVELVAQGGKVSVVSVAEGLRQFGRAA